MAFNEKIKYLLRLIRVSLAMGGILTDKFNLNRIILYAGVTLLLIFNAIMVRKFSLTEAAAMFYLYFISRYIFLFLSFIRNGIAARLKQAFGEEKGFDIYKTITALMFFQGAMSFSVMVNKSVGSGFPEYFGYKEVFFTAGAIMVLTGFVVNLWCAMLVGIDIYYYKDLFLGRAVSKFERSGPYLFFSNPMYGIGQVNGYGTAVIHASMLGIGGILLNQLFMYIFYYTIEKPHIVKVFGSPDTPV